MLSDSQVRQYFEEGYIILENAFSEAELAPLIEHIDVFDRQKEEENKNSAEKLWISRPNEITFSIKLNQKDDLIRDFATQDYFVNLSTTLLGPDVRLYWDQAVYKRPEGKKDFPWHQDNGYIRTEPEHYLTCWLALTDVTIENGSLWILPGSHRNGVLEHVKTDTGWQCYFGEDPGMAVPLKKGSLLAFQSLLAHRSGPNLSQGLRKAFILQYSVEGAKHPQTGEIFNNGPLVARNGQAAAN